MASDLKDALNDREQIWTFGQVNKASFYASVVFLGTVRPNQRVISSPPQLPPRTKPYEPPKPKDPTNELLDLLAKLFARYKSNNSAEAQRTYPKVEGLRGAHGVTATALKFSCEEGGDPGNHNWTIYIAKNAGPQDFDGQSDIDVAAELALWYNGLEGDNLSIPGPEEPVWGKIAQFWRRRSSFILDELLLIRKEWTNDSHTGRTGLPRPLKKYCEAYKNETPPLTERAIERDWALARDILLSLKPEDSGDETTISALVSSVCFSSNGWSAAQYPKSRYKMGEQLRKAVQFLKLLKTPKSVLKSLIRFRRDHPEARLRFTFLPECTVSPLRLEEMNKIREVIQDWPEPPINPLRVEGRRKRVELIHRFKKDREKVLGKLNAMSGGLYRTFHCELQLMDKFWYHDDVHPYFGGSKLSCYLCATLLGISKYRTGGSHLRLYADCAFPFTFSDKDDSCFVSARDALKNETRSLNEYILKKIREEDYDLSTYITNTQTVPGSMISTPADIDEDDVGSSDYSNASGEENDDEEEDEEQAYANVKKANDDEDEEDGGDDRSETEEALEG